MSSVDISSISLCPINFGTFNKINSITENIEASILFSKLGFAYNGTKITKFGKKWIIRSREQLAQLCGCSTKKIDALLFLLEKKNLIEKQCSLWFGKKRLFINIKELIESPKINIKLLDILQEKIGSISATIIFAKIAFNFANTKIIHNGKKYCSITKEMLSQFSKISIRSLDKIIENLIKKGLLIKEKFNFKGRVQNHFHIPNFIMKVFLREKPNENKPEEKIIHTENCRPRPEKEGISIKININKKKNNNTIIIEKKMTHLKKDKSDINFQKIEHCLSIRQLKYLEGALNNTIARHKVFISNPKELWQQLKFSITNLQQHKNGHSFKHVVSRCMKILSCKNWKTPFGFNNHSSEGRLIKKYNLNKQQQHEQSKLQEIKTSKDAFKKYFSSLSPKKEDVVKLTEEAKKIIFKIKEIGMNGPQIILENLNDKLTNLIRQGADKNIILTLCKQL